MTDRRDPSTGYALADHALSEVHGEDLKSAALVRGRSWARRSRVRRNRDQRRQSHIQPAEIAPALLLAVIAQQGAEDEILLGAELVERPYR